MGSKTHRLTAKETVQANKSQLHTLKFNLFGDRQRSGKDCHYSLYRKSLAKLKQNKITMSHLSVDDLTNIVSLAVENIALRATDDRCAEDLHCRVADAYQSGTRWQEQVFSDHNISDVSLAGLDGSDLAKENDYFHEYELLLAEAERQQLNGLECHDLQGPGAPAFAGSTGQFMFNS
jgi:hypothetical protein